MTWEMNRTKMFKILTLNSISVAGLDRLPRDHYQILSETQHPAAIIQDT